MNPIRNFISNSKNFLGTNKFTLYGLIFFQKIFCDLGAPIVFFFQGLITNFNNAVQLLLLIENRAQKLSSSNYQQHSAEKHSVKCKVVYFQDKNDFFPLDKMSKKYCIENIFAFDKKKIVE